MSYLHVLPDEARLAEAAADHIAQSLSEALSANGRARFVLTGGETPGEVYKSLATRHGDSLDWSRIDIFWGDERYVPQDSDESNFRLAKDNLLDNLGTAECNVYPFPTHLDTAEDAARAYEETLRSYFANGTPSFDVMLLGLGADGHVASLFPGADSVQERERWVLHTKAPDDMPVRDRITMTFPLLNAGSKTIFLVAGEKKREAVNATLNGTKDIPARHIQPAGDVVWYLDEAAAEQVEA